MCVLGMFVCFLFATVLLAGETETVGRRPYEMVDAGRTEDAYPPLIDFENLDGWTVETAASEARFERSREQQLWGDYVAKLTYKSVAAGTPSIVLKPPKPVPIGKEFDCVNFWVFGNNWSWRNDPTTPRVLVLLRLRGTDGVEHSFPLARIGWKEWHMLHKKFSAAERKKLGDAPAVVALEIKDGTNKDFRTIYFDNLSFYKEVLKPLEFKPRPKRGIDLPEGQTTGTNTGPGRLPFPNREETILPSQLVSDYKNSLSVSEDGESFLLRYEASDGMLQWTYTPKTGLFDDLNFQWKSPNGRISNGRFRTAGPKFADAESATPPELLSVKTSENTVTARWKFGPNEVEYRFQLLRKSLVIDVRCPGGAVREITFGKFTGLDDPRLLSVPYLTAGYSRTRPEVLMETKGGVPLFLLPMVDHTRSSASELFFENRKDAEGVLLGGSRYVPKTDGKRNDCFERLFVNVSPVFEEVLPNIPNDPSIHRDRTAERVWRIYHSSNLDENYEYWKRIRRYGVEKMMVVDHEVFWRDGGESFTFRTKSAPGKGGDEKRKEFVEKMHGLGYIYGPYNNFTDYAPVNEHWNEDWVTRQSDGNWKPAWARCYNPKPARAVEVEPYFSQTAQKKFGFNGGYCDVHTAVAPWVNVDYDARVPGAGTFAATFYAYGEILLNQKRSWTGPVYSEGPAHWFYSGLADGNFGHDVTYQTVDSPWLVDFDLLKIHPLENNCGMGYLGHFFGKTVFPKMKNKPRALDRFLAATFAFGHIGYLGMETGFASGIRSYFATQQLQARYAKQNIRSIRYADEAGNFLTTSQALAADVVRLNRIKIVYEDGLTFYINGNAEKSWDCRDNGRKIAELPPDAWLLVDPKGELESRLVEDAGRRVHDVDSPAYLFANIAGNEKEKPYRTGKLLCDRQLIVLKNADEQGRYEMIVGEPDYEMRSSIHAVRLDGEADADVTALDFERNEIGKAETRYSRGMLHVLPVDGAFSYLLSPKNKPTKMLQCKRLCVVPGETVELDGSPVAIPETTKPGTLYWIEKDGHWIDFEIVEPFVVSVRWDEKDRTIHGTLRYNGPGQGDCGIELLRNDKVVEGSVIRLRHESPSDFRFGVEVPNTPEIVPLKIRFVPKGENPFEKELWLKVDFEVAEPVSLPEHFEKGYRLRGKQEVALDAVSGVQAVFTTVSSGAVSRRGWSVHPPYKKGVGYVYLLSDPLRVPDEAGIGFSCEIGIADRIRNQTDGVLYRVQVVEEDKEDRTIVELNWKEKRWQPLHGDLTPWRGKSVRLRLVADVGPNNNSECDAGCWSEIRLRRSVPKRTATLHESLPVLSFQPPESPIASLDELSKATKVELVFEGSNLNCDDKLHVDAMLNGIPLGRLPAAPGGDDPPRWTTRSVVLTPEVIGNLQPINRLTLSPHYDCFKIRSIKLVATFADGTQRSGWADARIYSHHETWKHAEGVIAAFGSTIKIDLILFGGSPGD